MLQAPEPNPMIISTLPHEPPRKIVACPSCNNAEEGCCYCDHTGKVYEDDLAGWDMLDLFDSKMDYTFP